MDDKKEDVNDDVAARQRKLKFRSWHRGTREMDLLMGSFADKYVFEMGEVELDQFEHILSCNDPDLYNWITGKEQPPAEEISNVLQKLMAHRIQD